MIVLILALVASYGLQAVMFWKFWSKRRIIVPITSSIGVFAAAGMCFWRFNIFSLAILLVGIYRYINDLTIVSSRSHDSYLSRRTTTATMYFASLHLLLVACWWSTVRHDPTQLLQLSAISGSVLVAFAGCGVLISVIRAWGQSRFEPAKVHNASKHLPTVSLAIPARNETDKLERSLRAALASDYPKLEILVLDDCSQDATADIVKSFAHDGVRFVPGDSVPDDHWVHKNYAYQQLLSHASGKLVLFAGVDVVLQPNSISQMVAYFNAHKLGMLAVIPGRENTAKFSILQTIRYWWELALPRDALKRPPVLSSCWLADVAAVKKLGSFEAVSRMVVPEAYFAREFGKLQQYRLIRGMSEVGINSRKSTIEQYDTAVRVRYPQLRRRPELVLLLTSTWVLLWLLPLIGMLWHGDLLGLPATAIAWIGWLAYATSYIIAHRFYSKKSLLLTALAAPLLAFVDLIIVHISLYKYEFGQITWKGRNVCMPVMHVYKSLPPLIDQPDRLVAKQASKP